VKIIVTGGTGFVGWHTFHALLGAGHGVRPIDKKPDPEMPSGGIWADITNYSKMNTYFGATKPEAVIHLAAQGSLQESLKRPEHDAMVNIIGTLNMLRLSQKYGVKRFVFASTSAVYAPNSSGVYVETSCLGPLSPYGISKMAAEFYIRVFDISHAILRLGNVYGPRQRPLGENQLIPRALAHHFRGERFQINGDGEQKRDFVYVKDVADALVRAVESPLTGVFNIGSGYSISVNTIMDELSAFLGRPEEWPRGKAKRGELRNVNLPSHMAYDKFGWKATTTLNKGIKETVKEWAK
jgi:UDP-glucose 4-epimerase